MKLNYITTLILISVIYLFYVFPLSSQLFEHCEEYQDKVKEQVEVLDVETRLISGQEWAYALSDKKNNDIIDKSMRSIKEANNSYDKAVEIAFHILWVSLLYAIETTIPDTNIH